MDNPVCKIDVCGRPILARGFCTTHYSRLRSHGDPLGGGTMVGEPYRFLVDEVFPYAGDGCLTWPFSKNTDGYGNIKENGKTRKVNRIVCENTHGPAPSRKHEAAHSCGNGHLSCCNPNHLRWATPVENQADRVLHGTHNRGLRNGRAKLTVNDVVAIRESKEPSRVLVRLYGISPGQIYKIRNGKSWTMIELKDEVF